MQMCGKDYTITLHRRG